MEGQEGRSRQCLGHEGAPEGADGLLWKTGSGVVAALSQPPCYEGQVWSQALSLSRAAHGGTAKRKASVGLGTAGRLGQVRPGEQGQLGAPAAQRKGEEPAQALS